MNYLLIFVDDLNQKTLQKANMQNDVLLFSDIHIHSHTGKSERLEDCLNTLQWVFDTAHKNDVQNIIFGGDLFQDRKYAEIYAYHKTFNLIRDNLKGINLFLLLGNHDLWFLDNTSISSVTPFSSLPNTKVISYPERLQIAGCTWDFLPFSVDPIDNIEYLKRLPGESQYAIGHLAINEAVLHGNQISDVAVEHEGEMVRISVSLFEHYIHTFLGHYHKAQMVNSKVEYIGSPLQLSFGEAFQEKHCIIFNGKSKDKRYIVNDFSPKFLQIDISEKDKYDLKNNFVKIITSQSDTADIILLKKQILEKNNVGNLEIVLKNKKTDEHIVVDAKAVLENKDMLEEFINQAGSNNLKKDILLNIGRKICEEEGFD